MRSSLTFGISLIIAANIQSAIDYMTTQSFILKDSVIVVGQSAGGWDILALLSQNPSMVRAGIDFEGGRGGQESRRSLERSGSRRPMGGR